jgi:TolB protein
MEKAHPAWSPDGTGIVFDRGRQGDHDIYVMEADGSGLASVLQDRADDFAPAWSPDGRRVAFANIRSA